MTRHFDTFGRVLCLCCAALLGSKARDAFCPPGPWSWPCLTPVSWKSTVVSGVVGGCDDENRQPVIRMSPLARALLLTLIHAVPHHTGRPTASLIKSIH